MYSGNSLEVNLMLYSFSRTVGVGLPLKLMNGLATGSRNGTRSQNPILKRPKIRQESG